MEKIMRYKEITESIFREIHNMIPEEQGIDHQLIIDSERGHYLLYLVGWTNQRWVYNCIAHVDVYPDAKVWLQHDGTDLGIGEMLIAKGVLKEDLVPGFQSPFARTQMEGFAVA